ncbi:hypothetical protein D3C83_85050 [compost metagenome]
MMTLLSFSLALEGVRELDEELPAGLLEPVRGRQRPIVAVPDEHDRLPIQLVRQQHLPTDLARPGAGGEGIQTGIAIR